MNDGQLKELMKQDGGLRKLEGRSQIAEKVRLRQLALQQRRNQAYKTKRYKINDLNRPREKKQPNITLSNHRQEENQWTEYQSRENKNSFEFENRDRKKVVNVVQIMEKSAVHKIQVNN